jgi:hypothetical protein
MPLNKSHRRLFYGHRAALIPHKSIFLTKTVFLKILQSIILHHSGAIKTKADIVIVLQDIQKSFIHQSTMYDKKQNKLNGL